MPSDYAPLYFASAVLPDGRVLVEGGEYNFLRQDETNLGAIYDPIKNKWTNVNPPSGWSEIGDSPSDRFAQRHSHCWDRTSRPKARFFNANDLRLDHQRIGQIRRLCRGRHGVAAQRQGLLVDTQNTPNSEMFNPKTNTWTTRRKHDRGSLDQRWRGNRARLVAA